MQTLPSTASADAPCRKSQTSLMTVLTLCAAIFAAGTPAYPISIQSSSPGSGAKMAQTITPEEAAAKHQTLKVATVILDGEAEPTANRIVPLVNSGYWTAYPFTRKFLIAYVVYNSYCQEVTAGNWYLNYPSTYGVETEGLVKGRLSNGACPGYIFKSQAIYYKWVYGTGYYRNDVFEATWRGAGFHHQWVFHMRDR